MLFLAGAKDDWGALSCVQLANAQRAGIMQIHVYPDVYHAFDIPENPRYYLGHTLAYDAMATADAHRRVFEFLDHFLR